MSIRLIIARIAVALFGLTAMTQAYAWGDDGHRVVGEIAWHYLDPEVAAEIELLLDEVGEPHLAESTTWADRIRSNEAYNWAAPLHYINLSRDWSTYVEERDCPAVGCILKAIQNYQKVLADRSRTKKERAEALMFIAHFVGDLHQPLHTGLLSDKGGNDVQVQFYGSETNLHALWDIHLVSRLVLDWQDYAQERVKKLAGPKGSFGSLPRLKFGPRNPTNWPTSWPIPLKHNWVKSTFCAVRTLLKCDYNRVGFVWHLY
ncbi:S1/P1 nuclease [Microbulbifer sp. VAAF005]|nr:S1/P1 nuclease [Microbulbifer sp. VAAF005]WHI47083.1 S1/P1 nuclease [Microbulbifer sp. VAAF005]